MDYSIAKFAMRVSVSTTQTFRDKESATRSIMKFHM